MARVRASKGPLTVTAYRGDAKVLVAFDLTTPDSRKGLAGFTIQIKPPTGASYYLWNDLQFAKPADHARVAGEPAYSTANAPIHKFRWVHVPGLDHQGLDPPYGDYLYTVTPRYFGPGQRLLPLDGALSVSVTIELAPYKAGKLALGFTRGFVQSQAFVRHFGSRLPSRPTGGPLNYDTSAVAGHNNEGAPFTYAQEYNWLGFTARDRIFEVLDEVAADAALSVDVFAYDLNEPEVIDRLLTLGGQGRARVILDNAALHHDTAHPKPEDQFETAFAAKAGAGKLKRGKFRRYAHDKVFVVYRAGKAVKVLTGSTNFSVTGLYVNANHVLVFDDAGVAGAYADVFNEAWADGVNGPAFAKTTLAKQTLSFGGDAALPKLEITFSPHNKAVAQQVLGGIVTRCQQEVGAPNNTGSIFFAMMELKSSAASNPVYTALSALHASTSVFSYGVSDSPDGIYYYPVGAATGVLVTGKPVKTQLPPPFNQVPNIGGVGHQIHHKFVVCGFNGANPVVYCGSSNLALGGEQANGDNLLAIHDEGVATAFVIEALSLIDHFNFLDHTAKAPEAATAPPDTGVKRVAAAASGWFLGVTDAWAGKYFDPNDLHCRDRLLFGG